MDHETKIKIVKFKFLVQQSYMWFGLLMQGPMMAYLFYKESTLKWAAVLCLVFGPIFLIILAYIWYKYFTPIELEFNSKLNPEWVSLREEIKK